MKKVQWLCPIPYCNIQDLEKSNLASIRLRTAVAANTAKANGYEIDFSDGQRPAAADVLIVAKIDYVSDARRPERWLAHLRAAKHAGVRIIIDYTDHHLAVESPASHFYKEAFKLADTVVCSSQMLADHLAKYTSCKRMVIEDPIEVSIRAPKNKEGELLTALWFGHASNLAYLIEYLRNEFRHPTAMRLILMTNVYPLNQEIIDHLDHPELVSLEINVIPWSLKDMEIAAEISDFCLLPTGIHDPRKNGASSNRLLTALALGLPVATDLLASYMPLRKYFADIRSEEIKGLLEKPNAYFSKVKDAQRIIEAQYTKEAIAKRWFALIEAEGKLTSRSKNLVESVPSQPVTQPKLQILFITYNQEILCRRMIQNIESYVSKDIEVLIQDDCSQDRTYEILAKHFEGNPHVRIYRNKKNLGASRNSASLISKANSEYVLNLGGDDFVIPEEICKVTELLTRDNVDVGIFNCAHTDLAVIDHLILGKPKTTSDLNVFLRNNQFTDAVQLSEVSFYEKIATMPGALWGQGVVFRTGLLQKIKLLESSNVEEWGLFHNLAVYTQNNSVRTKVFKSVISLLAVMKNSRGSNAEAQLTRQLCAVANDWDESYRKTALINVLEKKLKQFRNSNLSADEVITAFKNSFSEVYPRDHHECVK